MLLPDWAREGGRERRVQAPRPTPSSSPRCGPPSQTALDERPHIRIVSYEPKPDYTGRALHEIAAEENRPLIDVAIEVIREGSPSAINFGMTEEDVRFVMKQPWVATARDGSVKAASGDMVHPRSFGTFPRKIGLYAIREKVLPLEQAVRSCERPAGRHPAACPTAATCARATSPTWWCSTRRRFLDAATFDKPFEPPAGIRWVFVNGVAAVNERRADAFAQRPALRHATRRPIGENAVSIDGRAALMRRKIESSHSSSPSPGGSTDAHLASGYLRSSDVRRRHFVVYVAKARIDNLLFWVLRIWRPLNVGHFVAVGQNLGTCPGSHCFAAGSAIFLDPAPWRRRCCSRLLLIFIVAGISFAAPGRSGSAPFRGSPWRASPEPSPGRPRRQGTPSSAR